MPYRPMVVTLFTDAGYCPMTGCASWAAWAKAEGRTMRKAGILKGPVHSSSHAEVMALANGVFCAVNFFLPPKRSLIVAQVDAMIAINVMLGRLTKKRTVRKFAPYRDMVTALLAPNEIDIDYRYVAGHGGKSNPRSAVNTWCDAQCTSHLKRARWELKAALTQEFEQVRQAEEQAQAEIVAKVEADTEARVGL